MIVVFFKTGQGVTYYIKFTKPGVSRSFTAEGLIDNATKFEIIDHAMAAARLIVTTKDLQFKKV